MVSRKKIKDSKVPGSQGLHGETILFGKDGEQSFMDGLTKIGRRDQGQTIYGNRKYQREQETPPNFEKNYKPLSEEDKQNKQYKSGINAAKSDWSHVKNYEKNGEVISFLGTSLRKIPSGLFKKGYIETLKENIEGTPGISKDIFKFYKNELGGSIEIEGLDKEDAKYLRPASIGLIKRNALEGKFIPVFLGLFFICSLFFLSSNLTGYAVAGINNASSTIIGGVLFVVAIGGFLIYRRKKN